MKAGTEVKKGGQYCCLYHLKNKLKLKAGGLFPACNFAGLNCEGEWHLLKEIKEKTRAEKNADNLTRKQALDKAKTFKRSGYTDFKEPAKPNKWDFEKW